tara:strand:- start:232 stop:585 length:354 start_codon:yes stop_codon:yes gene_type:complete
MAHFAKIGLNSKVIGVSAVDNSVLHDADGVEQEINGINFLTNLTGWAEWRQTFKDGTRKNYAGIGYTYDEDRDAFIPEKPFASWVLNEETCGWEAPSERPSGKYNWNEETQSWDPEA